MALPSNFSVHAVGVSFVPHYPDLLLELMQMDLRDAGPDLMLVRDLDNEYDDCAVAVVVDGTRQPLGHVPGRLAGRLAEEIDAGVAWAVERWEVSVLPDRPNYPGLNLWLRRVA